MTEIFKHFDNVEDLNNSAAGFHQLSKKEKLELLGELTKLKNESTGLFLNLIYPGETDKELQKIIRALIHKIKTTGVKVEEPKIRGESVLRKTEETKAHKAFMSNYDDYNARVVLVAFEVKKNNYIFLNGTVNFSDGLVDLLTAPVDKKGLEEIINEYRRGTGEVMVFVDISPQYAVYILEEAAAISGQYKEETAQARKFTSHLNDFVQKPNDVYSLEAPETTHPLEMKSILTHAVFEPFKLTWPSIEEDIKEYNSSGSSAIVLPPYMVEEKKQTFIKSLLEKNNFISMLPSIKRMLEDYAYIFYSLKEFPYYKGLADCLPDPATPLNTILYFLVKSLEVQEKKEEGVIVNPYG
jgi:hypothetical protein